jgi:hypothetical protein
MKRAGNQPVSPRNELKSLESGLGGRNRLDCGTVRPRVRIPGPRPLRRREVDAKTALPQPA